MATGGSTNTDVLSDETFDILCSVCKCHGKKCEAEKYCVECNNYYCLVCVKLHEDVALLSGHKMLDKGQFKSSKVLPSSQQRSDQTPVTPTERCNKHNHYYIDMYCQNHDDVGCPACIATDHKSCKDTLYIPEFLQSNATLPTSKETAQILEEVAKVLTESHRDLQHEKQKLLAIKADALEKIMKFRKEINDRLDKLEQNSINDIESLLKDLIEEIEKATKELQTNQSNIQTAQNKLSSPGNNVSQVFVNAKKGNNAAKLASKWIEENKTQIPVVDIDFKVDERISKLLEEINTLGNVIQRNMKDVGNTASSASDSQDQQVTSSQSTSKNKYPSTSGTIQQRNALLQGLRQKDYTVKVKSDKYNCNIVSACALEDGTIILSDYNNTKLKHLDSSTFTVTDYCDLPGKPWQVCPVNKELVAVCLPAERGVQFISVGSQMTKTWEINTDFYCYGLAYANDNLYISNFNTSVYIYSVFGSKLRKCYLDQTGQTIFGSMMNIFSTSRFNNSLAVSKDGPRIYVADRAKGLIVLDSSGQVVGRFNGLQLKNAHGCYLTETGSLLVCGYSSHNVLQFGPDGELIGEVVKSDRNIDYQAVCCNLQLSKLILGLYSNEIKVYDLEQQQQIIK